MATKAAHKRLTREYKLIQENPTPYIVAQPSESHILEWHYLITGPPDTPYEGGQYHGTLVFPADYPFKPPAIRMMTPSGRFKTNTRLCLSISDYHPKTWNPAWSVSTILTGLLSFMVGDETTAGSISTSDDIRQKYAKESHRWNLENNTMFNQQFPDVVSQNKKLLAERELASCNNQNQKNQNSMTDRSKSTSGNAADGKENADNQNNAVGPQKGFFSFGKLIGVGILLVSWILASRLFSGTL